MATVDVVNAKPNDRASAGDKFRVTWRWSLGEFMNPAFFDVVRFDIDVRNALPGMGFVPVSNPMATAGDGVIVYDVRLSTTWGANNKSVAQVVTALDKLPLFAGVALNVSRVERLPNAGISSGDLAAGQVAAVAAGNTELDNDREETAGIFSPITTAFARLGTAATALLVVAVAGAALYVYRRA